MSEDKNFNVNINLADSVDNAIKNVTDKPTRNIGDIFDDIFTLVFGEFHANAEKKRLVLAAGVEKFKKELEENINNISPEKLLEPNARLTLTALENAKYTVEEENLRKMFARLIANSMNFDYEKYVHPSYVSIIKDMSSLDAENLSLFKTSNQFPIVAYRLTNNSNYSFRTFEQNVFIDNPKHELDIKQQSQSLSSLERLGLVEITYTEHLKTSYEKFKKTPLYLFLLEKVDKEKQKGENSIFSNSKLTIQPGLVQLTSLGKDFIKACM